MILEAFLAGLPAHPGVDSGPTEDLVGLVTELCQRASARWNGVFEIPAPTFVVYLAEHIPATEDAASCLRMLNVEDLYLACGCVLAVPHAVGAFEEVFSPAVANALRRMNSQSHVVDEIKQRLREKLLVGQPGRAPRIAKYGGRGSLRAWVTATAIRAALDMLRQQRRAPLAQLESVPCVPALGDDPELACLKQAYRAAFKTAFEAAFRSLSLKDRTLLRHRYADGANIDEIGILYGVHRATAARWLIGIREQLFAATKQGMLADLNLAAHEFDHVFAIVQSRLELSISGFLTRATPTQETG